MKKNFVLIFATLFLQFSSAFSATSDWRENQSKGAQTRLIASFYKDPTGQTKLIAGVHFKIAEGWKIYGQGSDSIGLPPSFDFEGSKNLAKFDVFWPKPEAEEEKIGKEVISFFSYKGDLIIPLMVELQTTDQPTELNLKLNYGLCKDICIAVNETFSLPIPEEIDTKSLQEIQNFFPNKITQTQEAAAEPQENKSSLSLTSVLLLAIFGGAILNIMPCVLPVLSIKLMSLIKYSNSQTSRIRFAALSTILGILFCFIFFATLACLIKITGSSFGWGLQFQNPQFLIFLILVLVIFTGNLLGMFEINFDQFFATILNKKITKTEKDQRVFISNFFSGILAVLLATPCSAPFLGTAISFALVQDFSDIFLIFLFIGIGFALPYFILLITPKLVHLLPKPGTWMVQVKQLMAGLLAATLIWLIYVLSHNIGAMPAFLVGILSVSIFYCIKIKSELLRYLAITVVVISIFSLPIGLQEHQKSEQEIYNNVWIKFDEAEIPILVAQGKVVIVDITADWCITCKFNKIRVFQDKEIMAKLKGGDIIAMRGDITKPNEEIMNYLHKNNRFAIPFNAVYGPHAKDGLLTDELLNKKSLLELIDRAFSPHKQ